MRSSQYKALTGQTLTAPAVQQNQSVNSGQAIKQATTATTTVNKPATPTTSTALTQTTKTVPSAPVSTNQPTTAGGYVVPNVTQPTQSTNYLQSLNQPSVQPTTQPQPVQTTVAAPPPVITAGLNTPATLPTTPAPTVQPVSGTPVQGTPGTPLQLGTPEFREANFRVASLLPGFNGDINDDGAVKNFLTQNPDKIQAYINLRRTYLEPDYVPGADLQTLKATVPQMQTPKRSADIAASITTANLVPGQTYTPPDNSAYLQSLQDIIDQNTNATPSVLDNPASNMQPITRPENVQLPATLAYLKALDDTQRRAAIATDAMYGMGANQQSQDYYMQLLLNNLMDSSGTISNFKVSPIESQYLQMLGLNTGGSGSDFLTSLQRAYGYNFI